MNRRILTIIYAVCICIAFINYIRLSHELWFFPYWIGQCRSCIIDGYYTPFVVTLLGELQFQYFIVLSQFLPVTILCVGFAIICLWRLEALKSKLPVKKQDKRLHGSLISKIRSRAMQPNARTRILTVFFTACICAVFLNYISLKGELEHLQGTIELESKDLVYYRCASSPTFLAYLESLKFRYFLALSRVIAVSIFCAGFAVMTQWKIETLQPKPLLTEQPPITEQPSPKRSPLRFLRGMLSIKS